MKTSKLPDVCARFHCSPSTVERKVKAGLFPEPIYDGPRNKFWIDEELDAHYARLLAERAAKLSAQRPKRPRGRPPGSRNRPKPTASTMETPARGSR